MTDIVERLRVRRYSRTGDTELITLEAADEIDNLREELSIWKSVFPDIAPSSVLPDRSLLEAEIERLRAALREIAKYEIERGCPCNACEHSALARAALDYREMEGRT